MDFRLNDDQQTLQKAARDFCSKEITPAVVREAFDGPDGDAKALYEHMAALGWLGLTVPESDGGLGMTWVEQAVVSEQLGYTNAPGAYLSTACIAAPALAALGAGELVGEMVGGSLRAAVVWDPAMVLDAQLADGFLFVDGDRAVWRTRDEVDVTPQRTIDGSRRTGAVRAVGSGRDVGDASTLHFSDTPGVVDGATAALCAEMVGGMQWALDTTVAYVKDREQFGRPVGSFQAVQHRCADMLLRTEAARSAAYYAAYAVASGAEDAARATSVAKAYCSRMARWVTGEGIQLHGGIGYTWEHDMHLYFKRATVNQTLLGDAAYHYERALRLDLAG